MSAWFAALLLFLTASSGYARYYGNGTMQRVYQVRQAQGLVKGGWHGGLAATPSCKNIGRTVSASLWMPHNRAWGTWRDYLVVDCARPQDYKGQIARGLVIEVDYQTAKAGGWLDAGKTSARLKWGNK